MLKMHRIWNRGFFQLLYQSISSQWSWKSNIVLKGLRKVLMIVELGSNYVSCMKIEN